MSNGPFDFLSDDEIANHIDDSRHIYNKRVVCVTDSLGEPKYEWLGQAREILSDQTGDTASLAEIVVDASNGFVPLWKESSTLYWRFNGASLTVFNDPEAAKNGMRELWSEAIDRWGSACPVRFREREHLVDFEIVLREKRRCSPQGCVLASAFFPDGGKHEVVVYPSMFDQSREEQIETLVHEMGHIFGLRHFFAKIREDAWPSHVFGRHSKFSIMNYGADSYLTDADKDDLTRLYESVWATEITSINGTPIRLMAPFSSNAI